MLCLTYSKFLWKNLRKPENDICTIPSKLNIRYNAKKPHVSFGSGLLLQKRVGRWTGNNTNRLRPPCFSCLAKNVRKISVTHWSVQLTKYDFLAWPAVGQYSQCENTIGAKFCQLTYYRTSAAVLASRFIISVLSFT